MTEAVFVFDGGMSSKIKLVVLNAKGVDFVTRLSNATLEALLKELPEDEQLQVGDRTFSKSKKPSANSRVT